MTIRVFHEARHLWPKFTLLKNLKTEPPKTFSQNPLVVSLKIRKFVATYKRSAKVICLQITNKHFSKKIICLLII